MLFRWHVDAVLTNNGASVEEGALGSWVSVGFVADAWAEQVLATYPTICQTVSGMNTRIASLILSILGGALLLSAAIYLVSTSSGDHRTTTTDADGATVVVARPSTSILDDSPTVAMRWIALALAFIILGILLNHYGGIVGATSVAIVAGVVTFAGMVSHIGIYMVPGMYCFGGAAILSIIDNLSSK